MHKQFSFILVIIFLILGFFLLNKNQDENFSEEYYVKIAGKIIKVEIAETSVGHAQGLSARQGLAEGEGMLFIFKKAGIYPFWMKDMNFAIDIIWLNKKRDKGEPFVPNKIEDLEVIYIKKDARPESYPETFGPSNEQGLPLLSKYVLEVVSGFADKNNLKIGDKVEFIY